MVKERVLKKVKGKVKKAITRALKFDDSVKGFKKFSRGIDELKKLDVMAHKEARDIIGNKTQAAAEKAFKRLRKSGGGIGSYYDDIATWLHYEPKNKQEEIEKIYILSDFMADDNVRTKKGWDKVQKENESYIGKATGKGSEAAKYDGITALRFLKWRFPDTQKVVGFNDVSKDMEKVKQEILDWHYMGEPQ